METGFSIGNIFGSNLYRNPQYSTFGPNVSLLSAECCCCFLSGLNSSQSVGLKTTKKEEQKCYESHEIFGVQQISNIKILPKWIIV